MEYIVEMQVKVRIEAHGADDALRKSREAAAAIRAAVDVASLVDTTPEPRHQHHHHSRAA